MRGCPAKMPRRMNHPRDKHELKYLERGVLETLSLESVISRIIAR
jgi:hypothetical protein